MATYFPTGKSGDLENSLKLQREELRSGVARCIYDSDSVLTIIAGDFNWVSSPEDRCTKASGDESGGRDQVEEADWDTKVLKGKGAHELWQPMATHDSALARSRLDRVYATQHVIDQVDSQLACFALEWCPTLSNHRPVAFSKKIQTLRVLKTNLFRWAPSVTLAGTGEFKWLIARGSRSWMVLSLPSRSCLF